MFEIFLNLSPVFRALVSNGLDGFGDDLLKLIVVVVVGPRLFPFRGGRSQLIYLLDIFSETKVVGGVIMFIVVVVGFLARVAIVLTSPYERGVGLGSRRIPC